MAVVCMIFLKKRRINLHNTVWLKKNKVICHGKLMRISYSDIPCDEKYLKTK